MDKLRWGILGVANINNRPLPGFRGAQNADLVAIASRSAKKAAAAAKAAKIPAAHGTSDARLADRNVDAVQIPMAGGSLLDVGCYPVYGIRWAFGVEPLNAYATATIRQGIDLSMSGVLEFPGDRVGLFDCGFTLPLRQWLEISGTDGVIRVPEMW